MMHPLLSSRRILFVRDHCPHCKRWKKFIFQLNMQLKVNKRIRIIDCTKYYLYGIYDNPIIKLFEKDILDFPVLFFEGERKTGTNSLVECRAWLKARVFNDFYFPQTPEYFEEIDKYSMFNEKCRYRKGKIVCERIE